MMDSLRVHRQGAFDYKLIWQNDFSGIVGALEELSLPAKKICIVSDSSVYPLLGQELQNYLKSIFEKVTVFIFPAGEASKHLGTIQDLYRHLIENHFDRKDLLVALGGGVVGDMTGFAAATYLRGIDFIQVPTTLLAQVDSSIGGKTGVDFDQYKNMVGAFCQPRLVYMSLSALQSLSSEQFACGMAEVIKTALIYDKEYYHWLQKYREEILNRNPEILAAMIRRSCEIKSLVVEQDPTEKGVRAILNFGHTIGHAVEKLMDFRMLHGQCVALGMVAAAHISLKRGWLNEEEFLHLKEVIGSFQLPVTLKGLSVSSILDAVKSDKKVEQGNLKFILLKNLGESTIDRSVTEQEMTEAICYLQGGEL